ncbi:hypothetical protein ACTD5D_19260 [Nocardia takedensis]|uniref:hypothetical protein n=1 Tax=Nocardia takedensis TaxID=259390 RepID=UPI003F7680C0
MPERADRDVVAVQSAAIPRPIVQLTDTYVGGGVSASVTYNRYEFGVVSDAALLTEESRYVSQVREFIVPVDGLKDRDGELDVLAGFCRGDRPYLWIRAEPWAGKSALLSWFALSPPAGVTVVSFFVTDRLADQNDHVAFTVALLDQLAVLLPDHRALIGATVLNRDGLRNDLLTTAARREAERDRRLVLVIDGLDEDTGKPPIVSLLPTRPDPNLRIVVASRHGPRLPIPAEHPLLSARPYLLTSSPHAADVRERAVAELDALLDGPPSHQELLALITTANGLTSCELTELTDLGPYDVDKLLRGVAGRSFRAAAAPSLPHGGVDPIYALAHETLQRTAEERLGPRRLAMALERLHAWAEHYRDSCWPVQTPDFLLRRYFPVLDRHNDLPRMITAALDAARHDRIRNRIGGDATALAEIRTTQQAICHQPDPDLLSAVRLARHRDNIHHRNDNIPPLLLTVLARLGQPDRAEAIAHSYSDPYRQADALTQIADAIAASAPDRARRLTHRAQAVARTITDPITQDYVLTAIAGVVAACDPVRAETLARTINEPYQRADALARIAASIASSSPERAEAIAHTITAPELQTNALTAIACAIAASDPDRAEAMARAITDPSQRVNALVAIACAIAASDPDRAEAMAQTIADPSRRVDALVAIAGVFAASDPDRVTRLTYQAEAITQTIADPNRNVDALVAIAGVFASSDPDHATRLTDRAEALAHSITYPYLRVDALVAIAGVFASSDPDRATRLTDQAEALAHSISITYPDFQSALSRSPGTDLDTDSVETIAANDPDRAEALAHTISFPNLQVEALTAIAGVVAASDPERATRLTYEAEAIAYTITAPDRRTNTLTAIAGMVAISDPVNAVRLTDQAETLASTIPYPQQFDALAALARVVAATDPDRAQAIAHSITNPNLQVDALAATARVVAATDPDRAEAIVQTIADPNRQVDARGWIAVATAANDPDRAEALADTIGDPDRQAGALTAIANVIAANDPDRATRLTHRAEAVALTITDLYHQDHALAAIAGVVAVAVGDHDRAEAIVQTITDPNLQIDALTAIAGAVAANDPDRATRLIDWTEAIGHTITDPGRRADALTAIAGVVAATDPDRAEAIAHTITDPDCHAYALTAIAGVVAATDPDRAEAIAHTIADPNRQADALTAIAGVVAATDLDRAEAIAHTIADPNRQAYALTRLAVTVASETSHGTSTGCDVQDCAGLNQIQAQVERGANHGTSGKRLLARAWLISGWEVPISALTTIDQSVLDVLIIDLVETPWGP